MPIRYPLYSRMDSTLMVQKGKKPFMVFGSYAKGLFGITLASETDPVAASPGNLA